MTTLKEVQASIVEMEETEQHTTTVAQVFLSFFLSFDGPHFIGAGEKKTPISQLEYQSSLDKPKLRINKICLCFCKESQFISTMTYL